MALRRHRPIESLHLREVDSDSGRLRSSVADELYATREGYGVDLAYVADELRIPYDHLAAIEEGRFSDLPGPVYIVGFLRSYAEYLGLDADVVIARFKAEQLGFAARQDLNFPSPHDDGRVPKASLLVPCNRPSTIVMVLTAPMRRARSATSSQAASAASLWGRVTLTPRNPRSTRARKARVRASGRTARGR